MENDRPTMADFLLLLSTEEPAATILETPACPACKSALTENIDNGPYCGVCRERERINRIAQLISA